MNCEEMRNELLTYMRGALKGRKSAAVEKHLEICRECRGIGESYQCIWQELGSLSIKPPEEMQKRVEERVRKYLTPPLPVGRRLPIWAYGLAASLLILMALWFYQQDQKIPTQAAALHLQTEIPDGIADLPEVKNMIKGLVKIEPEVPMPMDTTLLGGRITNLNQMAVAQVMYQYQGIPISLFIWDKRWKRAYHGIPKNVGHAAIFRKQGVTVVVWEKKALIYCLVADLEPEELAAIFGLPSDAQYSP